MTGAGHGGAPAPSEPIRIVYIAGAKNCGSTLLDAILGNAPHAHSLGEVGGFYRYHTGRACACGQPPAACELCTRACLALRRAGADKGFPALSKRALKERSAYWTLVGTRHRRRYAEVADLIFDSVADTTGSAVLIDSSKNATRAAALVNDSRYDVRVIHIVRDGRGYLRSRESRAKVDGKRHVAAVAMVSWLTKNVLIGTVLGSRVDPAKYLICRYEDLISDPASTLDRICRFADLDPTGLVTAATTGEGVPRRHLYEPARRTDYRWVRLDPSRLRSQRESGTRNRVFWALGGFLSARWGYDRDQNYLKQP